MRVYGGSRTSRERNARGDSIVTLAVDAQTGLLTHTGQAVSCGSPACLVFNRVFLG
jgi:6-phosphogluconolactonase (cycloisomerase 2 family)